MNLSNQILLSSSTSYNYCILQYIYISIFVFLFLVLFSLFFVYILSFNTPNAYSSFSFDVCLSLSSKSFHNPLPFSSLFFLCNILSTNYTKHCFHSLSLSFSVFTSLYPLFSYRPFIFPFLSLHFVPPSHHSSHNSLLYFTIFSFSFILCLLTSLLFIFPPLLSLTIFS